MDEKDFDAFIDSLIDEAGKASTASDREAINLQIEKAYEQRGRLSNAG